MTVRDLMPHWISLMNKKYMEEYRQNPPTDKNGNIKRANFPYIINTEWDNKGLQRFPYLVLDETINDNELS